MVILLSMLMRMRDMKVRTSPGVHTGTQHTGTMGFNVCGTGCDREEGFGM